MFMKLNQFDYFHLNPFPFHSIPNLSSFWLPRKFRKSNDIKLPTIYTDTWTSLSSSTNKNHTKTHKFSLLFLATKLGENRTIIPSNIHEPIATNESSNLKRVRSRYQTRPGSTRPNSLRVQIQGLGIRGAKGSREKRRAKRNAIGCAEEHGYSLVSTALWLCKWKMRFLRSSLHLHVGQNGAFHHSPFRLL